MQELDPDTDTRGRQFVFIFLTEQQNVQIMLKKTRGQKQESLKNNNQFL